MLFGRIQIQCCTGYLLAKIRNDLSLCTDETSLCGQEMAFSFNNLALNCNQSALYGLGGLQQGTQQRLLKRPKVKGLGLFRLQQITSFCRLAVQAYWLDTQLQTGILSADFRDPQVNDEVVI